MRKIALCCVFMIFIGEASADYIAVSPSRMTYPNAANLSYGGAYGKVEFNIERLSLPSQKYWIGELLKKVFGIADSGEYILALELIDPSAAGGDKLVARREIAHFVKNPQGTLITDLLSFLKPEQGGASRAQDASYIVFLGDLSPRIPINATTNGYAIVLQLYKSSSATLTNSSIISSTIDIINSSASVMKFSPISAAEKTAYNQLLQYGFNIYQTFAQSSTLVASETRMSFITVDGSPAPNVVHFSFPFLFDQPIGATVCPQPSNCYKNTVDIAVSFKTYVSVVGSLQSGKFVAPLNWSQWLLQARVAGKTLPQYLASNDKTRAFMAAVDSGPLALKKFASEKTVDAGCDAIVNAIGEGQYFSAPDVGALYWSFLNLYWSTLTSDPNGSKCQSKYAKIYFEPYGLPSISTSELATPQTGSATRTPEKASEPATQIEAVKASKRLGRSALRDLDGLLIER